MTECNWIITYRQVGKEMKQVHDRKKSSNYLTCSLPSVFEICFGDRSRADFKLEVTSES